MAENKSLFEDYEINIIIGDGDWEWSGGAGTTRAVVELDGDISYAMPVMARLIESCGYNEETPAAAFRYKDFGVIVYSREILVMNAADTTSAVVVMDFLEDIIETAATRTEKVKPF